MLAVRRPSEAETGAPRCGRWQREWVSKFGDAVHRRLFAGGARNSKVVVFDLSRDRVLVALEVAVSRIPWRSMPRWARRTSRTS